MYTAISGKFVDAYMNFYDKCIKRKFGVLLSDVIKYLKIKIEKRFYENFRKKYKINQDYVIIRIKEKSKKGVKNAQYYISFDTFEKICMVTKSSKGEEVRDYFILLRKFIDYYKHNISDMLMHNIKSGKYGYMYIILVNKGKNIFKTGRSGLMRKRLYNYSTGKDQHPEIKFIMLVDNPLIVENCSNVFLKKYQYKNKQLYKVDIDLIKQVIFDCALLDENVKNNFKNIDDAEDVDAYVVYDDKIDSFEYFDENDNMIGYEKIIDDKRNKNQTGGYYDFYNLYIMHKDNYFKIKYTN